MSQNAKTVLHITSFSAPYGGAFIRQMELLDATLKSQGNWRTAMVIPHEAANFEWAKRLAENGIEVHALPTDASSETASAGSLVRKGIVSAIADAIRITGADVVHTHFDFDLEAAAAVADTRKSLQRDVKLIWHYRTALDQTLKNRGLVRRLKDAIKFRWFGRHVDACICVTQSVASEAVARGMRANKTFAVVAGCDTGTMKPCSSVDDRQALRRSLGLANDDVLIMHLGWKWHRKGGDLLAQAARILEERGHRNLVFWSIGAPQDLVQSPVERIPTTNEIVKFHQASDIFVHASRTEAFGNGLIEALACGRMVVTTAPTRQLDVIPRGAGCSVIGHDDPVAMADAIEQHLRRKEQWEHLGAENRGFVVNNLNMQRWAGDLSAMYRGLFADPSTPIPTTSQPSIAASTKIQITPFSEPTSTVGFNGEKYAPQRSIDPAPQDSKAPQTPPFGIVPRRVLVMIDHLLVGGAEKLAVEIAAALDRSRFIPHVLVTRSDGPLRASLDAAGVEYTILNRRTRFGPIAWFRAIRLARSFDIIHAHKYGSSLWGALISRITKVPLIVHDHNFAERPSRFEQLATREWISPVAWRTLVVSESVAQRQLDAGADPEAITVVRNGVHLEKAWPRSSARDELGVDHDSFIIGTIGRLRPEKGHAVAIDALRILLDAGRDVQLCLVGDGPLMNELRQQASKNGVLASIRFAGSIDDAARCVSAFDIMLQPSYWEGLPLAVLEAMAARVPVISSAVGGLPTLLQDDAGILVPAGDPALLARAIGDLMDDTDLARRVAVNGEARARDEYSFGRMISRIEGIYEGLLEEFHEEKSVMRILEPWRDVA